MIRKVRWSKDAIADLKTQISYIAARKPSAARRVATLIRAAGDELAFMSIGRRGRVSGTYEKSITGLPYIIAYAVSNDIDTEVITILRVIHGARDWRSEEWPKP